jgi:tetratricopeptide (TPR) repeat protein
VHQKQGNYKEALEMHKKSLAIRLKTFGEYHPDTAACYNNIGQVHQKQGNYKEALEMHKKSLAIRLKTLGENHPDTAKSYSNIGVVHEAQGNYKEALEYLKKALAIKLKTCGEDHPDTATCYGNIGLVQQVAEVHAYAMSRFKTGEQKLEAGLAVIGAKPQKLRSLKLSVFKEAKTNLEAALEIFTSLKNSKEVKKTLQLLVKLYTKTGDIGLEKRKAELKSIYIKEQEAKNTSEALERSINEPELFLQKKTAAPVSESDITCLSRDITNLEDVPMKNPEHIIRIISYNVVADFFDENDKTPDHRHHWENRKPIIYKLLCILATDIMCFQELSPRQAFELAEYFAGEFNARFLSQTPSEIPTGAIIDGAGMKEWVGKFAGTPLVGTFARKIYKISEQGRFWLNDKPDEVPVKADRGETDKGFGNMNTYRAVLWLKLSSGHEDKELFVFNSHYPLNGDNKTRKSCAELERIKIKEITAGGNWISSGDRNIVPSDSDNDVDNPLSAYMVLAAGASDIRGHGPHYGISTTWLGFSYDKFKTELDKKSKSDHNVLDVMISNMKTINSFFHPGGYDLSRGEENPIIPLSEYAQAAVVEFLNSERCFASDHALIGADFILVHGGE